MSNLNDLVEKGFLILNFDENVSDYFKEYDTNQFDELYLKDSNWRCKIKKLREGVLFNLLCKYENLAFNMYENLLDIDLTEHYNCPESLSSIIYYDESEGFHGEHTDYGFFNVVLNNDGIDCMYYKEKDIWKLFNTKNQLLIMNGDAIEEISDGKLKAVNHKVIKPEGYERLIATKICYPKNKKQELESKTNWL